MSSEKPSSIRRRLACDRCHSFKLKCPRSSLRSDDPCARCLKAGVGCLYSPSMRGQVRPKQLPPYISAGTIPADHSNESFGNGVSMPTFDSSDELFDSVMIDWTVNGENLLNEHFDSIPQLQPSAADEILTINSNDSNNKTDNSSRQTHLDCSNNSTNQQDREDDEIRILEHNPTQRPKSSPHYLGFSVPDTLQSPGIFLQLTNMMVTLESLARQLPSFTVHDGTTYPDRLQSGSSNQNRNPDDTSQSSNYEQDFEVGKTYAITQELVDIYMSVIEQTRQRKTLSHDSVSDPYGGQMNPVDQSSLWLLFSCHNRLIDLWHSMLVHAKLVQDPDRFSPDTIKKNKARCVRFKMGSYEPSSSSTVVAMEFLVLQELAMHLTNRLNDVIEVIDSEQDADGCEISGNLQLRKATIATARALHQRASEMRTEISQLKDMLEHSISQHTAMK